MQKNVTVTNRGIQLTTLDAKNVTVTNREIQLTTLDAKNVTVTNTGVQPTFQMFRFWESTVSIS